MIANMNIEGLEALCELMSFKQKLMKALENRNIDTYTYRSLIDLFNRWHIPSWSS